MKILFLHPNFPAQFKSPCKELALYHYDIKFICQTHYGRTIEGIQKLTIKGSGGHTALEKGNKDELGKMYSRAASYRSAFELLTAEGWIPDVVISHCGWGCGFYAKEIWPSIPLIVYCEWWFAPDSELFRRLKENPNFNFTTVNKKNLWQRNSIMATELATADHIVTPTYWQKKQLPPGVRKNCEVLYDKLNTEVFFPDASKLSSYPKLTYGTRGMEAMRGFPEFIRCLPVLLKKWPTLKVEIAGVDEINYGGFPPPEGSWGKWAKKVIPSEFNDRIEWKGRMPLEKYASWLKSSWCHVYLTEPYVASWSLNEAIATGIKIVATDHESVTEFTTNSMNVKLVDHSSQAALIHAINFQIRKMNMKLDSNGMVTHICKPSKTLADLIKLVSGDEANTTV